MKRLKWFKSLILGLVAFLTIGSIVSAQTYFATIMLTEVSGNSYTMFGARVPINTTNLITNGYITATGLDTRVMSGASVVPHMLADDKLLFAFPLPAMSSNQLEFYTGMTPLSNYYIIPGYNGYVTILDDPALEPGNNFEFEHYGYIDTTAGTDKDLLYKSAAFRTYVTTAGDTTRITSSIIATVSSTSATIYMYSTSDGEKARLHEIQYWAGGAWNNPNGGAGTNWNNLALAIDNNTATFAESNVVNDGDWTGVYQASWPLANVTQLRVWVTSGVGSGITAIDLNLRNNPGTDFMAIHGGTYTAGAWNTYDAQYATSASGVTTGVHKIKTTATGGGTNLLAIDIDDGTITDSTDLSGSSVVDNGNDWILGRNNVSQYYDYYKHTVSGSLIAHYEPATYITGTVLPDLAGAAQNGAFTWGLNPVGTAVTMSSLSAYGVTPGTSDLPVPPDVAGEANYPSGVYPSDTEMSGMEQLFYFIAYGAAAQTDTPIQFFWWVLCAIFIILAMTAGFKYSGANIWIGGLAGIGAIGACIGMALLPGWFILVAILIVTGAALWERTPAI